MSQEESRNAWKRREAQESLRDDRKSCFVRHEEAVNEKRRNTTEHDQKVQRHKDDRARWTGQSAAPRTPGGNPADAELAHLRKAAYADREARRNPPPPRVIHLSTLYAVMRVWHLETPNGQNFFDDDFSRTSMNNAVQTRLGNGDDISVEMVERSYQDCLRGNHLMVPYKRDPVTGGRVSVRGAKIPTPPTLFPAYRWPDDIAIAAREAEQVQVKANSQEAQRAMALTFADLQKEVRAKFKSTAVPGDVIGARAV